MHFLIFVHPEFFYFAKCKAHALLLVLDLPGLFFFFCHRSNFCKSLCSIFFFLCAFRILWASQDAPIIAIMAIWWILFCRWCRIQWERGKLWPIFLYTYPGGTSRSGNVCNTNYLAFLIVVYGEYVRMQLKSHK
jgi:hypothetical protein